MCCHPGKRALGVTSGGLDYVSFALLSGAAAALRCVTLGHLSVLLLPIPKSDNLIGPLGPLYSLAPLGQSSPAPPRPPLHQHVRVINALLVNVDTGYAMSYFCCLKTISVYE